MKLRNTAKLSSKFQISIPQPVRDKHHWQAGQEFAFISKGDSVLLVPLPGLDQLAGMFAGANPENYRDRDDRY